MILKKFKPLNQQFHPCAKITTPALTISIKTDSSINTYNENLQLLFSTGITGDFEIVNEYLIIIPNDKENNSSLKNKISSNSIFLGKYAIFMFKRGTLYKRILFNERIIGVCGDNKVLVVSSENKIYFFSFENNSKGEIEDLNSFNAKNDSINIQDCIKPAIINKNKSCINKSDDSEFLIENVIPENVNLKIDHSIKMKKAIVYNNFRFKNKILILNETEMVLYNFKNRNVVYKFNYVFVKVFPFGGDRIIGVLESCKNAFDEKNDRILGTALGDKLNLGILNLKTEELEIIDHKDLFSCLPIFKSTPDDHNKIYNNLLFDISSISTKSPYLIIVTSKNLLYFSNLNLLAILEDIIYASFIPNTEYIICISKDKIQIMDLKLNSIKKREILMPPYRLFSVPAECSLSNNSHFYSTEANFFNRRLLISNGHKVQSLSMSKDEQSFIFNIRDIKRAKGSLLMAGDIKEKLENKDDFIKKKIDKTNTSIGASDKNTAYVQTNEVSSLTKNNPPIYTHLISIDYNKISTLITTPFKNVYFSQNFYLIISHKAFILTKSFKVFRCFEGEFQSGAFDFYLDKLILQRNEKIEIYRISDKKMIKEISPRSIPTIKNNTKDFEDKGGNEAEDGYTSLFEIEIISPLLIIKDNKYSELLILDINSCIVLRKYSDCREYNFSNDLKFLIVVGEKMKIYDTRDDLVVFQNNFKDNEIKFAIFTNDRENLLICKEDEVALYTIQNEDVEINYKEKLKEYFKERRKLKFNSEMEDMCFEILAGFDNKE